MWIWIVEFAAIILSPIAVSIIMNLVDITIDRKSSQSGIIQSF